MIISHSRKFIFIKSAKTAGTSLEAALSNYCSGHDIVTPLGDYDFNRDETGRWVHRAMNAEGFEQHDWAVTIKDRIGSAHWNEYFKFSIARNPWDRVLSLFAWKARNDDLQVPERRAGLQDGASGAPAPAVRARFAEFVRGPWQTNDRFYIFDDACCVDLVIRYEALAEGTLHLCQRLGVPPIELPRLKAGFKSGRYHYSQYYDAETKAIVADRHRNDIRLFGYSFEQA